MADHTAETSPQVYARIGGWLYLYIIVAGAYAEIFVRDKLIVSGDATATANNLMAHESLWRVSVASELLWLACAIAVTLILYVLLKPVNSDLALLAVFFNLVSIAVEAVSTLILLAAMFPLAGASYLKAFEPRQLDALAYISLKLYDYGFGITLVFFGFYLLLNGYLVYRSGYFPKLLGVLLMIGGFGYLINSFALFLAPTYAATIFPILVLPFIAEASFCVWLIVMGVNLQKWEARASA